jgi:hypothetical protein
MALRWRTEPDLVFAGRKQVKVLRKFAHSAWPSKGQCTGGKILSPLGAQWVHDARRRKKLRKQNHMQVIDFHW